MTQLILASSSPRRIELMTNVGFAIEIESPEVDETPVRGESPLEMVKRLSILKAKNVASRRPKDLVIVAADTTVVSPDGKRILGKPRDEREAARMLASLAGKTHTVLTGYTVLRDKKRVTKVVRSRVRIRKLSREEIQRYVATGEPMDKAGAYAAQGIGMAFIESITGSYTNVVGLPMSQLLSDLERSFRVRPGFGVS